MSQKTVYRNYILIRTKLGVSAKDIHTELVRIHGDDAPDYSTVTRWRKAFLEGRESICDEKRVGRPKNATIDGVLQSQMEGEKHLSVRRISSTTGIPKSTVHEHLHTLGWRNVHVKHVPHSLSNSQKETRVQCSRNLLKRLTLHSHRNLIITGDETWVYYDNPHVSQWVQGDEAPEKVPKRAITRRKLMLIAFFSRRGIENITYLPEGKTVTSEFFCQQCILPMKQKLEKERRSSGISSVKFHFDNARVHTSKTTKTFLDLHGLQVIKHPPYSPDLSPCDFWLFGYLNHCLEGLCFANRDDAIQKCTEILNSIEKKVFSRVMEEWKQRLIKCIDMDGDYFE